VSSSICRAFKNSLFRNTAYFKLGALVTVEVFAVADISRPENRRLSA
jgi:hypothetical protein